MRMCVCMAGPPASASYDQPLPLGAIRVAAPWRTAPHMEPSDGGGAATQEADGAQNACASPELVEKLLHDGVMKDPRVSPDIKASAGSFVSKANGEAGAM